MAIARLGRDSVSRGFSIGGSLSAGFQGDEPTGQAAISAGFNVSFTSEEVRFTSRPNLSSMRWLVSLPVVGWVSSSNPANPGRAAYGGYSWTPCALFGVQGDSINLVLTTTVNFGFDWTRGLRYDNKLVSVDDNRTFSVLTEEQVRSLRHNTTAKEPLAEPYPFTVLEYLQSRGKAGNDDGATDTFLNMALATQFFRLSGASNVDLRVVVPTNEAFRQFFVVENNALAFGGPNSTYQVFELIKRLMTGYPAKWSKNLDIDEIKKILSTDLVDVVPCNDGIVYVVNKVPSDLPEGLLDTEKAALDRMREPNPL
jgi:hypothetical protein